MYRRHSSAEPRLIELKSKPQPRAKSLVKKKKVPATSSFKLNSKEAVHWSVAHVKPDILQKIKNYDPQWFEEICLKKPETLIDTAQYEQSAYYGQEQSVVFTTDKFVKYTSLNEGRPVVKNHFVGLVTSSAVSPDHSVLLVGVEEEGNAKVIGLNTTSSDEMFSLSLRSTAHALAVSSGSEVSIQSKSLIFQVFASLSSTEDRLLILTFNLSTGVSDCSGTVLTDTRTDVWEMTFCPADEGVVCALGDNNAFLMRCSGGKVENFSNIKFTNVLCHHWSNDVTMCFGTTQGELLLYRETIALEIIELNCLNENVTTSFNCVLFISSSNAWFGIVLSQGMIVIFENTINGPLWDSSRIIVMNQYDPNWASVLSFDSSSNFLLYTDGSLLMEISLKYMETITKSSAYGIAARHSGPINHIYTTRHYLISLDGKGNIIVTSRKTWRHIMEDKVENLILFAMISPEIAIFIKKDGIETRLLTIDGFVPIEFSPQEGILNACNSENSSHIAVLKDNFLMIFRSRDNAIIVEEKMKLKRDVRKMIFSTDEKYLIILTEKEEVLALDIATGKTIWIMDYKLKNFTDMASYDGTIYLLDSKFIVTREMLSLNMHAADINFNCSSVLLAANDEMLVCATDQGEIIGLDLKTIDQPYILRRSVGSTVSCIGFNEEYLFVGYTNGNVILTEFGQEHLAAKDYFDFTLCDHVTYTNLKTVINDLDYERNAIREESEAIINEYKAEKEEEIAKMVEEYTTSSKNLKEKVKSLEEDYIQSEEDRKRTISQLQQLYKEEERGTLEKFERLMNEQLKKILKLEDDQDKRERLHQQEVEAVTEKLRESFHKTEKTLQEESASLRDEIFRLSKLLQQMQKAVAKAESDRERSVVEFKQKMEDFYKKRKDDTKLLEDEIWNLKAAAVILTEDRDRCIDETSRTLGNLDTSRQQIASLSKSVGDLQKTVDQLKVKLQESERKEAEERRKLFKVQQKLLFKEKDYAELEKKAHKYTRRCGDLEAKISLLSGCVYDSRRLEHAVLSLLQNIDNDEKLIKLT